MRRRRRSDDAPDATTGSGGPAAQAGPPVEGVRAHGPYDVAEHPLEEDDQTRADLGALSVKGRPDVELRLQVDEKSGQVQAVMLVAPDGAMELRPFAAPRNEDLWDEVRPRLLAEAKKRGGAAQEVDGPFGTALEIAVPGVTPDGKQALQRSKVLGIAGPRWMLRVTMFGRPATDFREEEPLEQALREVVVVRGGDPMAPGDALPLRLPSGARRMGTP